MSIVDQAAANDISARLSNLINSAAYHLAETQGQQGTIANATDPDVKEIREVLAGLRVLRNDFENICAGLSK